jgi:mono/diheme cytochrome c family protein
VLFLLIQLVPYGKDYTNPPVTGEPAWDSPRTRQLFSQVCGDCHSNETAWPWYSRIAPISWLVAKDVNEGRWVFNVSEWDRPQEEVDEAAEIYAEGEMPPAIFLIMHPEARLSTSERQELYDGLLRTFGGEGGD